VPALEDVRHRIRHGLRQVAGASEVLRTSRSTLLAVAELARRYGGDAPAPGPFHGLSQFELRAFSQNGEDGVIAELLRRSDAVHDGFFVEFGAQQGVENNCAALADLLGWRGLFIEGAERDYAVLERKYRPVDRIATRCALVTPENVETLFAEAGVPAEPALLSIDVDGEDYWIWEAIEAYRPLLVVIEYNSGLEPGRRLVQPRGTGPWGGTSFVGASLAALESLGKRKGYRLVHTELTGNNAFFARTDVSGDFPAPDRVLRRGPNHWLRGEALQPDTEGRAYVDLDDAASSP
jgi:hypothetical protein